MDRAVIVALSRIKTTLIEDQEVALDPTHPQIGRQTTKRVWLRAVNHPPPARINQARVNRVKSRKTPRQVLVQLASPPVKVRASRAVSLQRRKRMD